MINQRLRPCLLLYICCTLITVNQTLPITSKPIEDTPDHLSLDTFYPLEAQSVRKIPKSIFIAPNASTCPHGQRMGDNGICAPVVANFDGLDFLSQQIQSIITVSGDKDDEFNYDYSDDNEPFQLSLPIDLDQQPDDIPDDSTSIEYQSSLPSSSSSSSASLSPTIDEPRKELNEVIKETSPQIIKSSTTDYEMPLTSPIDLSSSSITVTPTIAAPLPMTTKLTAIETETPAIIELNESPKTIENETTANGGGSGSTTMFIDTTDITTETEGSSIAQEQSVKQTTIELSTVPITTEFVTELTTPSIIESTTPPPPPSSSVVVATETQKIVTEEIPTQITQKLTDELLSMAAAETNSDDMKSITIDVDETTEPIETTLVNDEITIKLDDGGDADDEKSTDLMEQIETSTVTSPSINEENVMIVTPMTITNEKMKTNSPVISTTVINPSSSSSSFTTMESFKTEPLLKVDNETTLNKKLREDLMRHEVKESQIEDIESHNRFVYHHLTPAVDSDVAVELQTRPPTVSTSTTSSSPKPTTEVTTVTTQKSSGLVRFPNESDRIWITPTQKPASVRFPGPSSYRPMMTLSQLVASRTPAPIRHSTVGNSKPSGSKTPFMWLPGNWEIDRSGNKPYLKFWSQMPLIRDPALSYSFGTHPTVRQRENSKSSTVNFSTSPLYQTKRWRTQDDRNS